MDLLARREQELTKIFQYSGWSFFGMYSFAALANIASRGRMPYFRNFIKHSILAGCGTYASAQVGEFVAAELYYNRILI